MSGGGVMRGDWLKLYRKAIDSRVFSDRWLWQLWTWCLMRANWRASWRAGREILPGQFAVGRLAGAEELHVSPSRFYRGLHTLEGWGQLTLEANSQFTVVTICNWTTYQGDEECERTTDDTTSGQRMIQPADTNRRREEDKEGKNTPLTPQGGQDCLPCRNGAHPRKTRPKPTEWDGALPPELDCPAFRDAWTRWEADRKARRKGLTPEARRLQWRSCVGWGVSKAVESIERSIAAGWAGLFEPDGKRPAPPPPQQTISELLARGTLAERTARRELGR